MKAEITTDPKLVYSPKFANIRMDAHTSATICQNPNSRLLVSMVATACRHARHIQLNVPQFAQTVIMLHNLMPAQTVLALAHTAEQLFENTLLLMLEKSGKPSQATLEPNLRVSLLSPTKSSQQPSLKLMNAHTAANANSFLASITNSRN